MQLSNAKLQDRGIKMIMTSLDLTYAKAEALLTTHKNVRTAIENYTDGTRNKTNK
ncbi:hypothetical protein ACW5R3_05890 [Bizionia sp. KMM 8389]